MVRYNLQMSRKAYVMKVKVRIFPGAGAAYHFAYLGERESAAIKKTQEGKVRRGWGSVPVRATIGKTSWDTSVFPDKGGPYLLLLNARVRKAEGVFEGDAVRLTIRLR